MTWTLLRRRRRLAALSNLPSGAVTYPWYRGQTGTIPLANVLFAYQPKGAASLAASYSNLANPGTNDAAPGVAPTFNATTGWTFNGTTQYLTTGVTMQCWNGGSPTTSIAIRIANRSGSTSDLMGYFLNSLSCLVFEVFSGAWHYGNGAYASSGLAPTASGRFIMAGKAFYLNGSHIADDGGGTTATGTVLIGCSANGSGNPQFYAATDVIAAAGYNIGLSSSQAVDLDNALAAL